MLGTASPSITFSPIAMASSTGLPQACLDATFHVMCLMTYCVLSRLQCFLEDGICLCGSHGGVQKIPDA